MGVRAFRRAIRAAFGALGIVFLLGGAPIALSRDWGAIVVLLLPAIGVLAIAIAVLVSRQQEHLE